MKNQNIQIDDTATLADEPVIVEAFEKDMRISSPEPETQVKDVAAEEAAVNDADNGKEQHCACCRHSSRPTPEELAFAYAAMGRHFGGKHGKHAHHGHHGGMGFCRGFERGMGGGGGGGKHHGRFGHHRAYSPPGWNEIKDKDVPRARRGGKFGRGGRCSCERRADGEMKNVDTECLVHGTERTKGGREGRNSGLRRDGEPRAEGDIRGGGRKAAYKGEGRCVCSRAGDGERIKDVAADCLIHGKDGLREVPDQRAAVYGRMAKVGRGGFDSASGFGHPINGHGRHGGGRHGARHGGFRPA